jgi:hypothetical protein
LVYREASNPFGARDISSPAYSPNSDHDIVDQRIRP